MILLTKILLEIDPTEDMTEAEKEAYYDDIICEDDWADEDDL